MVRVMKRDVYSRALERANAKLAEIHRKQRPSP